MSAVSGYKMGEMPRYDFDKITSRPLCLNIAQDAIDHADENRVLAKSFTNLTFAAFGCIALEAAISVFVLMSKVVAIAAVADYVFLSLCGLQVLTVFIAIYCLWNRASYSARANNFEMLSMVANARAAELPPWSGTGIITGIFSYLFSMGNSVTKVGSGSIGGQTVPKPDYWNSRPVRY